MRNGQLFPSDVKEANPVQLPQWIAHIRGLSVSNGAKSTVWNHSDDQISKLPRWTEKIQDAFPLLSEMLWSRDFIALDMSFETLGKYVGIRVCHTENPLMDMHDIAGENIDCQSDKIDFEPHMCVAICRAYLMWKLGRLEK